MDVCAQQYDEDDNHNDNMMMEAQLMDIYH